jgi:hypothetical protein
MAMDGIGNGAEVADIGDPSSTSDLAHAKRIGTPPFSTVCWIAQGELSAIVPLGKHSRDVNGDHHYSNRKDDRPARKDCGAPG